MRKVKLQMQITLDGYIAGPNGEMDWMVWNWDDELKKYVAGITEPVDCIILGRNLAQDFMPHWAAAATNPEDPDIYFARKLNDTPKVVFSKTLKTADWENTKLAKGDIVKEITDLKKQPGKDIIAYGGGNFVSNLISHGLIDEYHLFVNPVALGSGMSIFNGVEKKQDLKLVTSRAFDCGIALLYYQPK